MKVVLILCDALRADRITPGIMPNLFSLAEKSAYFPMFFADGGATAWSMPFFLCGQKEYDPDNTFPGKLTKSRIHNSLIHSNAVLKVQQERDNLKLKPYEQCFKEYLDTGVQLDPVKVSLRNRFHKSKLWSKTRVFRKAILGHQMIDLPYRRASTILNYAQLKLDEHDSGFWWVHLMDPHIPYCPPGLNEYEKKRANELYEYVLRAVHGNHDFTKTEVHDLIEFYNGECKYMDEQIIRFINANKDCLFIITSDHGEMFGETHSFSHGAYYHGMTLQLGHIPFFVYKEGMTDKIIFDYHSSVDIAPTILDIFGLDPSFGYGRSMKEEMEL